MWETDWEEEAELHVQLYKCTARTLWWPHHSTSCPNPHPLGVQLACILLVIGIHTCTLYKVCTGSTVVYVKPMQVCDIWVLDPCGWQRGTSCGVINYFVLCVPEMFTVSKFGFLLLLLLLLFFSRRPWAKSNSSRSVLGKHAQYGDGAGGQQCSVPIMLSTTFPSYTSYIIRWWFTL